MHFECLNVEMLHKISLRLMVFASSLTASIFNILLILLTRNLRSHISNFLSSETQKNTNCYYKIIKSEEISAYVHAYFTQTIVLNSILLWKLQSPFEVLKLLLYILHNQE